MPLDPKIAEHIASAAVDTQPATHRTPEPEARRASALKFEEKFWERQVVQEPAVDTSDHLISVPGYPDLILRVYRPRGVNTALPGYLVFFGGAFRQGGLHHPITDWMYRARAAEAGIAVVAADYALAPEHRYPTQIEQGLAALAWMAAHGAQHGIDPDRLAIGGQSSGGNIAAAVTLRNRDADAEAVQLQFQLLEVPVLDLSTAHMDFSLLAELGIPLDPILAENRSIADDYLGETDAADPGVSPLNQASLAGLPPSYLMLAEYDVLRGDGEAYYTRLRADGVPASATVALGQTHDSAGDLNGLLAARHWHDSVVAVLRTLHRPHPTA